MQYAIYAVFAKGKGKKEHRPHTNTRKREYKLTGALIFFLISFIPSLVKRIMSYTVGKQNHKCMVHIDGK